MDVVYMTKVLHVISGDLWAGAEAQACTLLKHLKQHCTVIAVLLNEGELADRLRASNIPVSVLDESKLSSLQILKELISILTREKPDIVHTHRQKENILGAVANRLSVNARSVRTVHGASESEGHWKSKVLERLDQWVGNHLQDRIIAVSEDLKSKLLPIYRKKLIVINNGVDIDELHQKSLTAADFKELEPDRKHIGIVGRLVPVKRVDLFLEAASLFKTKMIDDFRFHVIGDGPLSDELKEQASALNLNSLVTFHGHRSDIPQCIKSLDTVIMCSDHEGMPMVALETLALGTQLLVRNTLSHLSRQFGLKEFSDVNELLALLKQPPVIDSSNVTTASQQADNYLKIYE